MPSFRLTLIACAVLALWSAASTSIAAPQGTASTYQGRLDDLELQVSGRVLVPGGSKSAGGSFALAGAVVKAAPVLAQGRSAGEEFELVSKGRASVSAGADCLCGGLIFQDGFESGGTSSWN